MDSVLEEKWVWKMNYCKIKCIPPAQSWAWNTAERAWFERVI